MLSGQGEKGKSEASNVSLHALVEVERFALPPIRLRVASGTAGFLNFEFTAAAKTESRVKAIQDRQAAAASTDKNLCKGQ